MKEKRKNREAPTLDQYLVPACWSDPRLLFTFIRNNLQTTRPVAGVHKKTLFPRDRAAPAPAEFFYFLVPPFFVGPPADMGAQSWGHLAPPLGAGPPYGLRSPTARQLCRTPAGFKGSCAVFFFFFVWTLFGVNQKQGVQATPGRD